MSYTHTYAHAHTYDVQIQTTAGKVDDVWESINEYDLNKKFSQNCLPPVAVLTRVNPNPKPNCGTDTHVHAPARVRTQTLCVLQGGRTRAHTLVHALQEGMLYTCFKSTTQICLNDTDVLALQERRRHFLEVLHKHAVQERSTCDRLSL